MTNMVNKAQGFGLSLLTKMASSDLLDQFKLRKLIVTKVQKQDLKH